jgi:hypothetical protein
MLKELRFLMAAALLAGGLPGSTLGAEPRAVHLSIRTLEACATPEWLGALRRAGPAEGASQAVGPSLLPQEQVLLSADGHFQLHYPGTLLTAAPQRRPAHPTRDLLARSAGAASRALAAARLLLIGHNGWTESAGDRPLDVYLVPGGPGGPSRVVPVEDPALLPDEGLPSYMVISGPPATWAVQAVHQYIHVLQFGYSVREAAWLYEAGALAIEERLAVAGALPPALAEMRLERPERSLTSESRELMGGAAIFLAYLMETRGDGIVRRAWERAGAVYGENSAGALDSALRLTDHSTLREAWREFTIWNAYPAAELRPAEVFSSLKTPIPTARSARVITDLPAVMAGPESLRIEPLGAAYVRVSDLGEVGSIAVEVEAEPGAEISADVLVSWRPQPAGWLAAPLQFVDGRASLGVPLETSGQMVVILRNDATSPGPARPVSVSLRADPVFPFDLAFLSADASPGQIDLSWGSESEHRIYGWMVYRAEAPQGPFRALSRFPVPSLGDSRQPLAYNYTDTQVEAGRLYYYLVEGITLDGLARRSPSVARRAFGEPGATD